jgi:hypothetical protein
VPFEGDTTAATLQMQISQPPQPPRERNPNVEITDEAERVVLRALEKDPARRQSSMDELWAEMQRCHGAMRWRRPELANGSEYDSLRAPLQLSPARMRDEVQATLQVPSPAPLAPAQNMARPLLLTRRKTDKWKTAVKPEDVATPPPARVLAFGSPDRSR